MKFCVITHVEHVQYNSEYFAYAPYVNEMNIWFRNVEEVNIVAPISNCEFLNPIDQKYQVNKITFSEIKPLHLKSFKFFLNLFLSLPYNFIKIYRACKKADHIHLRCPGNIGLIGCIVQIFFPSKPKTAKYAGNWDPQSNQPLSYKLQKFILSNTFLTKNIQVLVYGDWPFQSKNIKPFFTATYSDNQCENINPRKLESTIKFMFVGTLSEGKRPIYAVQLIEGLFKKGINVSLDIYGEGKEKVNLEKYIQNNNLSEIVFLKGNQKKEIIEKAFKQSHFLILASKSEGWPKVVAEAMFWGCLPLTTNVSCVNYMIGNGERGKLLTLDLNNDLKILASILQDENNYIEMCTRARDWSQQFTLDFFESEIKKILDR